MLRELLTFDTITVLLVFSIALIATTKLLYSKQFTDFSTVLINSRYLKMYSHEKHTITAFDVFLGANTIINIIVFVYIAHTKKNYENTTTLINITIFIAAFYIVKYLLTNFILKVFEIENRLRTFLFQKISYSYFIGLLLLPINAILLYNNLPLKYYIIISIGLIFIIVITGLLVSIRMYQNEIKQNLFYFILYICALEISPYLILYKLVLK